MSECSRIFVRYNGFLSKTIADPVSIAGDLYQLGAIPLTVKERAELNTTLASERTAQLLTAVHKAIKGDFQPPKTFIAVINALKKHEETRALAEKMESEYYGNDKDEVDGNEFATDVSPWNTNNNRQRLVSSDRMNISTNGTQGERNVVGSVDSLGTAEDSHQSYPAASSVSQHDPSVSQANYPPSQQYTPSQQEPGLRLSFPPANVNVEISPGMINSIFQAAEDHPYFTRSLILLALLGTGFLLYKRFIK